MAKDRFKANRDIARGVAITEREDGDAQSLTHAVEANASNQWAQQELRLMADYPFCRANFRRLILEDYLPYLAANPDKTLNARTARVIHKLSLLLHMIKKGKAPNAPFGPESWTVEGNREYHAAVAQRRKTFRAPWMEDKSLLPKAPPKKASDD